MHALSKEDAAKEASIWHLLAELCPSARLALDGLHLAL